MGELPQAGAFNGHKTIGALILLLAFARLSYRLANPPPPFPDDLAPWERVAGGVKPPLVLPTIPGIPNEWGETFGELHGAGA